MRGKTIEARYCYLNDQFTSFRVDGLGMTQLCSFYPAFSCPIRTGLAKLGDQPKLEAQKFTERKIRAAFKGLPVEIFHVSNIETLETDGEPVDVKGIEVKCGIRGKMIAEELSVRESTVREESPGGVVFLFSG